MADGRHRSQEAQTSLLAGQKSVRGGLFSKTGRNVTEIESMPIAKGTFSMVSGMVGGYTVAQRATDFLFY